MNPCNSFIFGRTLTKDYRWLTPPDAPILSSFISKTLEYNAAALTRQQLLFVAYRDDDFCIFSMFFKSNTAIDERGRPIYFSVGFSCGSSYAREFNYRLPALIADGGRFISEYSVLISKAIQSDSVIPAFSVDIRKYIPRYRTVNSIESTDETRDVRQKKSEAVDVSSFSDTRSEAYDEYPGLVSFSDNLLYRVDTPSVFSNYNTSDCGAIVNSLRGNVDLVPRPLSQSVELDRATSGLDTQNGSILSRVDALVGQPSETRVSADAVSRRKIERSVVESDLDGEGLVGCKNDDSSLSPHKPDSAAKRQKSAGVIEGFLELFFPGSPPQSKK